MRPERRGTVTAAVGDTVKAQLPFARLGEGVTIAASSGPPIIAFVSRLTEDGVALAATAPLDGVAVGDVVRSDPMAESLPLGMKLLGRVIDSTGAPLDGRGPIVGRRAPVLDPPIPAGLRAPVAEPFWTGIRAIDSVLTIGRGARVGIFGAPAAGKSTLIEMLVHGARADAVVIGLIGERGREAAQWISKATSHSTIVVAPLDRSPAERMRGAQVAMAQASQLRRRGLNVLLILDSLARFVAAARELAIANGEAAGRGGYPPSVFSTMARLLERAGNAYGGSITMLATVLSDGGDEREPLSEAARAALDGHIVLSSSLAQVGHYPAIDITASVSRTMNEVVRGDHRNAAQMLRRAVASLEATKETRALGLATGDPFVDRAVQLQKHIDAFLRQAQPAAWPADTLRDLRALADALATERAA